MAILDLTKPHMTWPTLSWISQNHTRIGTDILHLTKTHMTWPKPSWSSQNLTKCDRCHLGSHKIWTPPSWISQNFTRLVLTILEISFHMIQDGGAWAQLCQRGCGENGVTQIGLRTTALPTSHQPMALTNQSTDPPTKQCLNSLKFSPVTHLVLISSSKAASNHVLSEANKEPTSPDASQAMFLMHHVPPKRTETKGGHNLPSFAKPLSRCPKTHANCLFIPMPGIVGNQKQKKNVDSPLFLPHFILMFFCFDAPSPSCA